MKEIWTDNLTGRADGILDITVKSGLNGPGACLAPTWELVGGHKHFCAQRDGWPLVDSAGKPQWFCQYDLLNDDQYTEKYLALLRSRWVVSHEPFMAILRQSRIVLGCYCEHDAFCHRKLAADVLVKLAETYKLNVTYKGEIPAESSHPTLFDEKVDLEAMQLEIGVISPKNADFRAVAESLVELMRPHCDRVEIAGSVRRGKAEPNDIEIVLIPKPTWHAFCDDLVEQGTLQKRLVRTKVKDGIDMRQRWGNETRFAVYQDVSIDLFCAQPDNWGYQLWLRTGPGDANHFVMGWLATNDAPVRFKDGYGWASGRRLRLAEEEDLFAVLGLPIISPAARTQVVYQTHLVNTWPDFTPYFMPEEPEKPPAPRVQQTFIPEWTYVKEDEVKAHRSLEKIIERWCYEPPWLGENGQVWVHIGYGEWALLSQSESRAQIQLDKLQRLGVAYRYGQTSSLETWLIGKGFLQRKEIEVVEILPDKLAQPVQPATNVIEAIEMKALDIFLKPENIEIFPDDFVGERVAVLGISGSGKSYTIARIIEQLCRSLPGVIRLPCVIIDQDGEYWGLKTLYDFIVIGRSEHSDIDIPAIHAPELAEYCYKNGVSLILDFKGIEDEEEMYEFCLAFFKRIWHLALRHAKPYEIILDEAADFIPQTTKTPITKLFSMIARRGRKHGMGVILASQRSQDINKKILSQSGLYFLHRVIHPNDMAVYNDLIPLPPKEIEAFVGKLDPGQCIFMRNHIPVAAQVKRRDTFHAATTPSLTRQAVEHPPLKPVPEELLEHLKAVLAGRIPMKGNSDNARIVELELVNAQLRQENADLETERDALRKQLNDYIGQDVPQNLVRDVPENVPKIVVGSAPAPEEKPATPSIMEIAAEKVLTAEEKAYEKRLNVQKAAFQKILFAFDELPNWQKFALAYLTETGNAYSLEDLAHAIGIAPKTVIDKPLMELREWEFIERLGTHGNRTFKSRLDVELKKRYPELNLAELKKRLFKTVKELA